MLQSYFPESLYIRELDFSANETKQKKLWVLNGGNDQQKWGKIGTFNDCSTELKTFFSGVVVGFGPKGMPGRMCDSACALKDMFLLMILNQICRKRESQHQTVCIIA